MNDRPGSMMRDVVSAYAASGARVLSWVLISALVYRRMGLEALALLALIRLTLAILNYTTLGLPTAIVALSSREPGSGRLTSTAHLLGGASALLGAAVVAGYCVLFGRIHGPHNWPESGALIASILGAGMILRLASDVPGSLLQARGHIAIDNWIVAAGELMWPALAWMPVFHTDALNMVGAMYLGAMAWLLAARFLTALLMGRRDPAPASSPAGPTARHLLAHGLTITASQLADYLYAPAQSLLIERLIGPSMVGVYWPAVQIDAALLLLVSGLSAVLLPKAAIAASAGDRATLRRYFVRGTLASAGILLAAALVVWAISPWLFRAWFGSDMPATRAILPLVLIHSVVGGAGGVGRSIMLGMGLARAYTLAALAAGVGNVLLGCVLVKYAGLGLAGIVLATIVVVVARCGLWMPWYILRRLPR
jgi:O-antigen/teichoic acid export membrane protein